MKYIKTLEYNILIKIIVLILLVSPFTFKSQNMSIFGNIIDTLNNTAKKNAVVMLVRLSDS